MYKVRFHLGRGKNYMHWWVKDKDGNVEFFNPDEVCLVLNHCKLHNQANASKKIFNGENKRPCAWVLCSSYEIFPAAEQPTSGVVVNFSPRKAPHWQLISREGTIYRENADNFKFVTLYSYKRTLHPDAIEAYLI